MTTDKPDTSVVVIGGGQAGLSVSYYLKRLGLEPGNEFVVLDRGPGTGGAWQFRWDALRIGSAHRINDLPGLDALDLSFETADRQSPAKEVVASYYRQYEDFYGFQIVRPAAVTRVENVGPNLAVTFTDGVTEQVVTTDVIINATGTWGSPFIPWYPGLNSFTGKHVHTTEYRSAEDYAGQNVVVVGGGTSAIGFLLELENVASRLTWVSRRPVDFREDGELNLEARVSAVAMQDEAARAGRALPSIVSGTGVPRTRRIQAGIERGVLDARPIFTAIEPDGVRFADGSFEAADVIIWSTGFRPELRHLAPLKLREKEGGFVVANGTSWKDPRVFFAGYGPQASTIGANRAGRTIARQAIATLSRIKREQREERDAAYLPFAAAPFAGVPFAAAEPFIETSPELLAESPESESPVVEAVPAAESPAVERSRDQVEPVETSLESAETDLEPAPVETQPAEPTTAEDDLDWLTPSTVSLRAMDPLPEAPSVEPESSAPAPDALDKTSEQPGVEQPEEHAAEVPDESSGYLIGAPPVGYEAEPDAHTADEHNPELQPEVYDLEWSESSAYGNADSAEELVEAIEQAEAAAPHVVEDAAEPAEPVGRPIWALDTEYRDEDDEDLGDGEQPMPPASFDDLLKPRD